MNEEKLDRSITAAMQNAKIVSTYSRQIHDNMLNAFMTDEEKRRRKACPNNPLAKSPGHYLTGYEGSECDKPEPIRCGKFKYQMIGVDMGESDQTVVVERDENGKFTQIDLDEFKKQCEDIDKGES